MRKIINLTNIISIIFLSTFFSLLLSFWIAENYLFDKLFYNKSIAHGYWAEGKTVYLSDFGKRSKDLISTFDTWNEIKNGKTINKSSTKNQQYIISLNGDSYVWGQGVRYQETLTHLIEKKLNKFRDTEIISMGISGNSILELWKNFYITDEIYDVNLFIFIPVINDSLLKNNYDYENIIPFWSLCKQKHPDITPVYDWTDDEHKDISKKENPNSFYNNKVNNSWENKLNLCLIEESLKRIPADKSIFFIPDYYDGQNSNNNSDDWDKYLYYIKKHHKNIIFAQDSKNIPKFEKMWKNTEKYFQVSKNETHPSRTAHEMYTEVIVNEILSNKEYNFLLK
jgi:hypothetical protein